MVTCSLDTHFDFIIFRTLPTKKCRIIYDGCPEIIQPSWIYGEPFVCPWCNFAAIQRRSYCSSLNSHPSVGLVSRQWDAVDWACVQFMDNLRAYVDTQGVPGGKVNIQGGHSIGHYKQKVYMYMCPIQNGFRDRDISLYSSLIWRPMLSFPPAVLRHFLKHVNRCEASVA